MMHLKRFLSRKEQEHALHLCRLIANESPLFTPTMANGTPFRYQNTSAGDYGWISDKLGYRYSKTHPNGKPWAKIPPFFLEIARHLASLVGETEYKPETCLLNFYTESSRLGLHQDNTEPNLKPAVVSLSLGDSAVFLLKRGNKTEKLLLESGDALILHGDTRLAYHGIERILTNTSNLLRNGGRLNLTFRQLH
jgi:DNA oxidative demethylase